MAGSDDADSIEVDPRIEKLRQRLKGARQLVESVEGDINRKDTDPSDIGCGEYDCSTGYERVMNGLCDDIKQDMEDKLYWMQMDINYAECKGHDYNEYERCKFCIIPEPDE
jgi:hypothetical protein